MRLLIVDNNIDPGSWGAGDLRRSFAAYPGVDLFVRRAPARDLPRNISSYDRIVVSGSKTSVTEDGPWITELMEFMKGALDAGKPLLGVCYGHQLLARTLGDKGNVRRSSTPEIGWTKIETQGHSPLLNGMPESFYSFSWHLDEVSELPRGLTNLARSESCAIQAFQVDGRPAFGIQFHPEKNLADAKDSFSRKPKGVDRKFILNPEKGSVLYDAKVGETIFRNFLAV